MYTVYVSVLQVLHVGKVFVCVIILSDVNEKYCFIVKSLTYFFIMSHKLASIRNMWYLQTYETKLHSLCPIYLRPAGRYCSFVWDSRLFYDYDVGFINKVVQFYVLIHMFEFCFFFLPHVVFYHFTVIVYISDHISPSTKTVEKYSYRQRFL